MLIQYRDVFRSLHSHGVRYLVIKGVAAVTHGVPRATFDLDLIITPDADNVSRLLDGLLDAGLGTAALTHAEQVQRHEITVFRDRIRVDVQTSAPGLSFEDAWPRRRMVALGDTVVNVVSREDLIAAKRASGRPVDLQDVELLRPAEPCPLARGFRPTAWHRRQRAS